MIDCIYIAASDHDTRSTRICISSVRFFYPDLPVRLLLGGKVPVNFLEEVDRLWNVQPADITPGNYGWGFIKLEPLFQPRPERFLVLDSDTILLGPVVTHADQIDSPFIVDDERQSEVDTKRLYYDWEKVRIVDTEAKPPQYTFNSGQWFGSSAVVRREEFTPWVRWDLPRTLLHPKAFMPGDQGILNYVLNQKAEDTLVARRKLMRWPGHDLGDIALDEVKRGSGSPYRQIVHWAGFKAARLESLPRSDLLLYFEQLYYQRHGGERLRRVRGWYYALKYWQNLFCHKFSHRFAMMRARFAT